MTNPLPDPGRSLIAILRGLRPDEAVEIASVLVDAGFRVIEVPLNSPDAPRSIASIRAAFGPEIMVGSGTVLTVDDVAATRDAGGQLCVSPNYSSKVVRATKDAGMVSCPGVATPSEAFSALADGADVLKIFPSEQVGTAGLKAWGAVLPAGTPIVPVGGIDASTMAAWRAVGATGFGLGSSLYKAGRSASEVDARARELMVAWEALS